MSGNLYQLRHRHHKANGLEFYINGPYDLWGYIVKMIEGNNIEKGGYLYLVRGTGSERKIPW